MKRAHFGYDSAEIREDTREEKRVALQSTETTPVQLKKKPPPLVIPFPAGDAITPRELILRTGPLAPRPSNIESMGVTQSASTNATTNSCFLKPK